MRVAEGKAIVVTDYRPGIHLVAAENSALHILDVDDQQALRRQDEVIDLDLALIGFGDDESLDPLESDVVQDAFQRAWTVASPVADDRENNDRDERNADESRDR